MLNECRYELMAIIWIYYAAKIENFLLIPLIFLVSTIILSIFGWMSVHHMAKVMDYLNIEFSTHFLRHNINLQEEQLKQLKELNANIKKLLN